MTVFPGHVWDTGREDDFDKETNGCLPSKPAFFTRPQLGRRKTILSSEDCVSAVCALDLLPDSMAVTPPHSSHPLISVCFGHMWFARSHLPRATAEDGTQTKPCCEAEGAHLRRGRAAAVQTSLGAESAFKQVDTPLAKRK